MDENISVVIPVMNEEEKIAQCLEAVFSQSLKAHEMIVVDGHSSDETVERWNRRRMLVAELCSWVVVTRSVVYIIR